MAGKHNTTGTLYGEVPGSGKAAEAAHPELSGVDALQLVLDLAGMVPGAGAVPDLINAAISALRGDWFGAGLSLFSAAPGVGDAAGAARIVKNGEKYLQALKAVETKVIPKLPDWIAKPLQDFVGKARKKLEELMGADKVPKKDAPEPEKPKGKKEDNAQVRPREKKVPCFHPFDKKKFAQMTPDQQKGYLKEMADQLKRQQDQINNMSALEYKAARDTFEKVGRNPLAEGAQANYRNKFAKDIQESIRNSLMDGGMGPARAKTEAASRTKDVMGKLAALHEPDMVAGGWMQPDPKGMGRADVNSSIGSSWNQNGRIQAMDDAADEAIKSGRGDEKMKVKLEPCRGKGMK